MLLLVVLGCLSLNAHGQNGELVLEGVYQGRDLYVRNPFAEDGVGFCVFEVEVNGKVTSDEVNSSAFALDMSILGLEEGDPVTIKLKHRKECRPGILNPEAIKPRSTFEITQMELTPQGRLSWTSELESGRLVYAIEQFKWNKWVKVGEVMGNGTRGTHTYQFELDLHSGVNRVRLRQTDHTNKPRYSPEREVVNPNIAKVTFEPRKVEGVLRFSAETSYEIFDEYGNLVKRGRGRSIDTTHLEPGTYYLNYDNSFGEKFVRKG